MSDTHLMGLIAETVRKVAKIPGDVPIHSETRLVEDLGVESLDLVGIVLEVQDRFGVEIAEDDVPSLGRLADLTSYVASRRESAAA